MMNTVEPALGDVVFIERVGEPERPLRIKAVVGARGKQDAAPGAHWVELSDGSSWWVTLRKATHDSNGRRAATWAGAARIWPTA
jgi:hypothetical protein